MNTFLLDTSALLTLRDDEPGADEVATMLNAAREGDARCLGCFMSLMEVLYRVWKDEDEQRARLAYQQCQSLPMEWVHESVELLEEAAAFKARYPLSVADAWIAACASLAGAVLVHKDPEFAVLELPQHRLPSKPSRG